MTYAGLGAGSATFVGYTLDPRTMTTGNTLVANRAAYLRYRGQGPISKIGLQVGTSSGNVCVAVYANNGSNGTAARPGTLLASSGSVACPAAGYAEIALGSTAAIKDGDWLYLGADNATATFFRAGSNAVVSDLAKGLSHYQDAAFPAPGTAVPAAGNALFSFVLIGVA